MRKEPLTPKDIRQRTDGELEILERQLKEELFKYRVERATSRLDDVTLIKITRRELARVKTVLKARRMGLEPSVSAGHEEGA